MLKASSSLSLSLTKDDKITIRREKSAILPTFLSLVRNQLGKNMKRLAAIGNWNHQFQIPLKKC